MSALGWVCAVTGSWIIVACLGTAGWSFAAGRLKRRRAEPPRRDPFTDDEGTVWAPFLPPVPPSSPRFPVWDDVDEISFRWFAEGSAR